MKDVGGRLQQLRTERHLTQQDLSDQAGIDRDKIAKIETGARRMSGTELLYLAEALGVPARQLAGARPDQGRYRGDVDPEAPDVVAVSEWLDDFIEDYLFLERTARRHDLE